MWRLNLHWDEYGFATKAFVVAGYAVMAAQAAMLAYNLTHAETPPEISSSISDSAQVNERAGPLQPQP